MTSNVSVRQGATRWSLRAIVLTYLFVLLILPVTVILWRTFENGLGSFFDALTTTEALHAFKVTLEVAIAAVICNTVFGVAAAILLVRHRFPGAGIVDAIIDLPLAVSPVVVGLALILVYGRRTTVGSWFGAHGINIIFSLPGMVMATIFVSLPLVIRAVAPVLAEVGDEQEQAASTLGATSWQTFFRITLPSIRGALAYGVVLALARSLGEFGAIAVVSGALLGKTQTVTLFVQERFQNFDQQAAYAGATALVAVAVLALIVSRFLRPRGGIQL
jgi:sulfate transport system permease protein